MDDATRAALLVRLARSLAVLPGQERPVRRALDEAQASAERLSPLDGADVMANSGIALSDLGQHAKGVADLQTAITSMEAQPPLLVAPLLTSRRMDVHVRHILTGTRRWGTVREIRHAREQLREVTR